MRLAVSLLLALVTGTAAIAADATAAAAAFELSPGARTLVDMQIVHLLLAAYARERGALPETGSAFEFLDAVPELRHPFFTERSSGRDGWGRPLLYWSDGQRSLLLSTGPDGRRDERADPVEMLDRDFRPGAVPDDIVLRDGYIAQFPTRRPT